MICVFLLLFFPFKCVSTTAPLLQHLQKHIQVITSVQHLAPWYKLFLFSFVKAGSFRFGLWWSLLPPSGWRVERTEFSQLAGFNARFKVYLIEEFSSVERL